MLNQIQNTITKIVTIFSKIIGIMGGQSIKILHGFDTISNIHYEQQGCYKQQAYRPTKDMKLTPPTGSSSVKKPKQ